VSVYQQNELLLVSASLYQPQSAFDRKLVHTAEASGTRGPLSSNTYLDAGTFFVLGFATGLTAGDSDMGVASGSVGMMFFRSVHNVPSPA
jgi:hypothetical protein